MTRILFILSLLFSFSASSQTVQKEHPENGKLPFNAPCQNCVEDLDKRKADSREFFEVNADGSKTIYMQRSLGNLHMPDENGNWITIDPRPVRESEHVYAARQQLTPVVINVVERYTSISNSGFELRFNKNISLVHLDENGIEHPLGEGNWDNYTMTEQYFETKFLFKDFYAGIDLEIVTGYGKVKSSFIINTLPAMEGGFLVMKQEIAMPEGVRPDLSGCESNSNKMFTGQMNIADFNGRELFRLPRSNAFDARTGYPEYMEMPFSYQNDLLQHFVPLGWLKDPSRVFPVALDPFVQVSNSLPQASINGSGFTNVCDSNGCSFFLNVMTPANCEITAIDCYFSYLANLPCIRDDGGFGIKMTNPSGDSCMTRHFTCLGGIQGACFFWPAALLATQPIVAPCVPAPHCAPYQLDFELMFRRCNWIPVVPCDASCVLANSPWTMTIIGRTIEIVNLTVDQTICEGECVTLSALADFGVPSYSYQWTPGNLTGSSINVCPDSTTQYLVQVQDSCGETDSHVVTVSVVEDINPGFNIIPDDTVCDGTNLIFMANGNLPQTNFGWTFNCGSTVSYFDTSVVSMFAPAINAVCTATLFYEYDSIFRTCVFPDTQLFVVNNCSGIFGPGAAVQSIHPNPAHTGVNIVFGNAEKRSISIYDVVGKRIREELFCDEKEIYFDLSEVPQGIYLVAVKGFNQQSVHKIIVH